MGCSVLLSSSREPLRCGQLVAANNVFASEAGAAALASLLFYRIRTAMNSMSGDRILDRMGWLVYGLNIGCKSGLPSCG